MNETEKIEIDHDCEELKELNRHKIMGNDGIRIYNGGFIFSRNWLSTITSYAIPLKFCPFCGQKLDQNLKVKINE